MTNLKNVRDDLKGLQAIDETAAEPVVVGHLPMPIRLPGMVIDHGQSARCGALMLVECVEPEARRRAREPEALEQLRQRLRRMLN